MEEDKQQWLSIVAVVLVIGGLGYFLFRQGGQEEEVSVESAEVVAEEKAQELIESMNFQIPEEAEKVTLRDIAGLGGAGIVTKVEEDGSVEYSVLAALPDPIGGEYYEAYLVGEGDDNEVYMGKLSQAKGGWMLEFDSTSDLGEFNKVKVTKETVDDKTSEDAVLEGEF